MAARSPLFAALRRAASLADLAARGGLPLDEAAGLVGQRISRRELLKGLAAGSAGLLASACAPALPALGRPAGAGTLVAAGAAGGRVVVVGAGLAGLTAAHALAKAGVAASVYEAADRVGGRVKTRTGLVAPGVVTELGAEFIDSGHARLRALARELGLPLLDAHGDDRLEAERYVIDGVRYGNAELARAVAPLLPRLRRDQEALPARYTYDAPGAWTTLDRLTIADYLDRLGASGWSRRVIELAFATEFGLDVADQSALNLVGMIGTRVDGGRWEVLGESDERWKVRGGNQRIAEALAARLRDRLVLGHRLLAIASTGAGYRLTFGTAGGPTTEVAADAVVLALPFTLLREVDVRVELPAAKRRAIAELGYGRNAKLLMPLATRPWHAARASGAFFADAPLQCGWDHTAGQATPAGGLTLYLGGREAEALARGTAEDQAAARMAALEGVFPGVRAAYRGGAERALWPTNPWSRGSYACYRPGQTAAFRGAEGEPVGRLAFAGEHCSLENQSFMEGAVETGLAAAAHVVKALGAAAR